MTGAGAPGAAGILKCLKQEPIFHVLAADANPNAVGRWLNKEFEPVPIAQAPLFIDAVMELCRKNKIDIILPLVTKELIPFAASKDIFEKEGIKILVSSKESLEIANSKSRLYEFLQWRGIEVPEFRIVETVEQFRDAMNELGYPGKQLCFKPSVANGSRGFRILSENINESDLLFNQKPSSLFMRSEDATRILSSATFPELLISEYLPGEEYSVDCLAKNGEPILVIPRLRTRMVNGISVEGEFIKDDSIIDYCSRIIKELKLHGNIGIQVKRSAAGKWLILEVNPRVQGSISACLGAGVNLPVLAIKQELGLKIGSDEMSVSWGMKFSRYWQEVFY